ncbi:sensor histidine kinase [Actinocorallia longicatena]|uniref:histidine kinase n=1 Tax=Actinocorallia longicatena TaxID=111803 RepID=A0ABP6QJI9_9ACTN
MRTDRILRSLAIVLGLLGLAATAGAAWTDHLNDGRTIPGPLDWSYWGSALSGLSLLLPGSVLAVRMPRHWLTWLLIACGASSVLAALGTCYATYSLLSHDGDLPLTWAAIITGGRFGPLVHFAIPALMVLFPDGLPRRLGQRILAAIGLTLISVAIGSVLTLPWQAQTEPGVVPHPALARFELDPFTPPGLDRIATPLTDRLFGIAFVTGALLVIAVFVSGYRAAGGAGRAQRRWMLLALIANLLFVVLAISFPDMPAGTWDVVFVLENMLLSAAAIIAITRYRLYDVDLLLGWTLLYAVLAAAVVAIDLAVFVAVQSLVRDRVAGVAAAGVVAVLYSPLRVRLQRLVNRLLTGRGDPYEVVSALARRLEESPGPEDLLEETARGVAAAYRSPYVRVELDRADGTTLIVEEGTARADAVVLPFGYRDAAIGRLALVPRRGTRLSEEDQRLLADVVRQAAAAVRATALTEELQRSREGLVTGIAEERRRLRRDLHDGLGPSLAAAGLKIQAARNLAGRDAERADRTLTEVGADLTTVLGDVRRLVHDLRPPALDQFGLLGAIRQQAARFGGGALAVTVTADGDTAGLPAAVEVAVFRIVGEALSNVARHAAATRCTVVLARTETAIRAEITDDGRGVPAGALVGVGIVAMRERAAELGGSCLIEAVAGGGTRVRADLPAMMGATPEQGAA